jgi:hypothetical protein
VWQSENIWVELKQIEIAFRKKLRGDEVRECLLPFGPGSFVFQFVI